MTPAGLTVKVIPNDKSNPPGKLADAELYFSLPSLPELDTLTTSAYGKNQHTAKAIQGAVAALRTLNGLRLIEFSVWERRTGHRYEPDLTTPADSDGQRLCKHCDHTAATHPATRNVTFPARQYSVNSERRSFALLRPTTDAAAQDRIRDLILNAYAEYEAQRAAADPATETTTATTESTAPLLA